MGIYFPTHSCEKKNPRKRRGRGTLNDLRNERGLLLLCFYCSSGGRLRAIFSQFVSQALIKSRRYFSLSFSPSCFCFRRRHNGHRRRLHLLLDQPHSPDIKADMLARSDRYRIEAERTLSSQPDFLAG